jgi:hypothetical protein
MSTFLFDVLAQIDFFIHRFIYFLSHADKLLWTIEIMLSEN